MRAILGYSFHLGFQLLGLEILIAPEQDRQEVGARLLQAATEWARNGGFEGFLTMGLSASDAGTSQGARLAVGGKHCGFPR